MLNRRDILQAFTGFLASAPFLRSQPGYAKAKIAHPKFIKSDNFVLTKVFTPIKIEDGQISEFPLDFLSMPRAPIAYVLPKHKRRPVKNNTEDFVYVPTYEIGAAGPKVEDVVLAMKKKIDSDALRLLYCCALESKPFFVEKDEARLQKAMLTHFRRNSPIRLGIQEFLSFNIETNQGKYILYVLNQRDNCVMPIRQEPTCFVDEAAVRRGMPDKYYGYADLGLAVLDSSCIFLGMCV